MVTIEVNGRVIAAEGSCGVREDAEALHDMLYALSFGDDAETQCKMRNYGMAACALMVEKGLSAQYFFAEVSR